jgi:sulfur relay (sulfurtransferase) complex TusBCD TusD component (DsrE family)
METVKQKKVQNNTATRLHFLIIISNPRMQRHMLGVVNASHKRGHKITVFFNEESVKLLLEHNTLSRLPADMLACVTACQYSGIKEEDFVEGARMTSLGEAIEIMQKADRTLFMG